MPDKIRIIRDRQRAMRREIDRRGIALKQIQFDSGIPMPTLLSYFPGGEADAAVMPVSALFGLIGALPSDILSLLLPTGHVIVHVPEELDHYEAEAAMRGYLGDKSAAHHPDSEAGPAIGPNEDARLRVGLSLVAAKVAA